MDSRLVVSWGGADDWELQSGCRHYTIEVLLMSGLLFSFSAPLFVLAAWFLCNPGYVRYCLE